MFYSCVAAERGHVNLFLPEAAAAADGAAVEPEKKQTKQTDGSSTDKILISLFHFILELFDLLKETEWTYLTARCGLLKLVTLKGS